MKDDNLRNENLIKGFCIERYFERLPGFIDVTVLTETQIGKNGEQTTALINEPEPIAVPLC